MKNQKLKIFFIIFFLGFIFFFLFNKNFTEKKIPTKSEILEKNENKILKIISVKQENIFKNHKFFDEKIDKINYTNKILNGIIISKDGKILTNKHILGNNNSYFVFINNKKYKLQLEKIIKDSDLVIFKIKNSNNIFEKINFINNKKNIFPGEKIFNINYKKEIFSGKILKIINNYKYFNKNKEKIFIKNVAKTNLKNNFGDSGSPVFNTKGEVIGINSFKNGKNSYFIILDKKIINNFLNNDNN